MKKSAIALAAVLLSAGASLPALAAWDNIGSVTIQGRSDRDVRSFDLGGPVESLQLRADGGDVNCRSVNARFGNGRRVSVFDGELRAGRTVNVNLPGRERNISSLDFNCSTRFNRPAVIRISADVGRYRNDWMRGPNWGRTWSRMFNWGSNAVNNWQQVGMERFEGRNDSEMSFVGLRGRHVDNIALMPVDADARCSRVSARFDNGRTQVLNLNNGDYLRRGQYTQVNLPGNYRNLDSLSLRCSATNARAVTIRIFTSH
jgi:hypothetical protein